MSGNPGEISTHAVQDGLLLLCRHVQCLAIIKSCSMCPCLPRDPARPLSSSAAWANSFVREAVNAVPYDPSALSNGADRAQEPSQPAQQDPAGHAPRPHEHDITERQAGDAQDLASVQQYPEQEALHIAAPGILWEVSSHATALTATGFLLRCATDAHFALKVSLHHRC
jgi:hypothetical protein